MLYNSIDLTIKGMVFKVSYSFVISVLPTANDSFKGWVQIHWRHTVQIGKCLFLQGKIPVSMKGVWWSLGRERCSDISFDSDAHVHSSLSYLQCSCCFSKLGVWNCCRQYTDYWSRPHAALLQKPQTKKPESCNHSAAIMIMAFCHCYISW